MVQPLESMTPSPPWVLAVCVTAPTYSHRAATHSNYWRMRLIKLEAKEDRVVSVAKEWSIQVVLGWDLRGSGELGFVPRVYR